MRILVVSQYFYPENFRINDLTKELVNHGHDVTVLTGKPNYPKGEYFDGYKKEGVVKETWEGVKIIRVPLKARKQGAVNLLCNYISFVLNANKFVKTFQSAEFDIIYVFEVSPVTVALPAIKLKKRIKIPIIMNVQDLWPENIIAITGINNSVINFFINKLVSYIYNNVDIILAASPSFISKIKQKVKNESKVYYWPQYSTVSKSEVAINRFDKNKTNIVFTGNIGEAQGIDLAIQAASFLRNEGFAWHFIGSGRSEESLRDLVIKLNLQNNVFFHGQKEEMEIPSYLSDASAALLILKPNPVFEMTIPAKLQTYLSCGVPILGCVSGEGKKIIEEANCGLVSDEISVDSLIAICKQFKNLDEEKINEFKKNSFDYGNANFLKEKLIQELLSKMEELV